MEFIDATNRNVNLMMLLLFFLFPGGSSGSSNDNRNYRYSNRYYNSAVTHSDYEMTSPQVRMSLRDTQVWSFFKKCCSNLMNEFLVQFQQSL